MPNANTTSTVGLTRLGTYLTVVTRMTNTRVPQRSRVGNQVVVVDRVPSLSLRQHPQR